MADAKKNNIKAPELLIEVIEITTELLVNSGHEPDDAYELARQLAKQFSMHFGGSFTYWPKGTFNGRATHCLDIEARHAEIKAAYNGRNAKDVMSEFSISKAMLHRIINQERHQDIASISEN